MQQHIQVILHSPSHPGNIGAVARAMRVMGVKDLRLVNPRVFPHPDAIAQASGAQDVLENATVHTELQAALADCQVVMGTSARTRDFPWPVLTPRLAAEKIASLAAGQKVGLLFGTERYGLANVDIEQCHYLIHIPTAPDYRSLNLAQAVQIMCYEIFQQGVEAMQEITPLANMAEVNAFYAHLRELFTEIGFLDPKAPRLLMRRFKHLLQRVALTPEEVQMLRGMLSAFQKHLQVQK